MVVCLGERAFASEFGSDSAATMVPRRRTTCLRRMRRGRQGATKQMAVMRHPD